jgi:hypothetical protein
MTHDQEQPLSTELYGYTIRRNQQSGRWDVFWREVKQAGDFATRASAEQWIDDLMPLNR